jgi:hypothetical protein
VRQGTLYLGCVPPRQFCCCGMPETEFLVGSRGDIRYVLLLYHRPDQHFIKHRKGVQQRKPTPTPVPALELVVQGHLVESGGLRPVAAFISVTVTSILYNSLLREGTISSARVWQFHLESTCAACAQLGPIHTDLHADCISTVIHARRRYPIHGSRPRHTPCVL